MAWKHQFQFAGYYAALNQGFYRQAGLDVVIMEGGEGRFAREAVRDGRAQYGVAGSELILHRRDGDPFVVLAPIFQHSPSILLARRDGGLSNLQDLIGKRVMLLPGNKDADILAAFLNEGVSLSSIQRLDQSYNLDDLIEGRTDAVSAYLTNEPWLLMQKGIEPAIISLQTYGVDFYSDCLFTTESEVENHPRRVQAFLEASLLGWEYAMAHPEEIIDLLLDRYHVQKSRDHLRYEADSIRKIMLPDLVQIGHMNPGRWRHIARTYGKLGLLDADFNPDGFLYAPIAGADPTRFIRMIVAALVGCLVLAVGALVLFFFNRRLANEVADRKQAQGQLVKSNALLTSVIRQAPFAIHILEGNVHRINAVIENDESIRIMGRSIIDRKPIDADDPSVFATRFYTPDGNRGIPLNQMPSPRAFGGETVLNEEFLFRHADGTEIQVQASALPVYDHDDQIMAVTVIFQDITDRKRAEQEKAKFEQQLRQAQKMDSIGRLAGGVAHDFNNMLSIIVGNTDMLLEDIDPASPLVKRLREISKASVRSTDLVRQLLAFARRQTIAPRVIKLNETLASMLKMLKRLIGENIDLSWRPKEDVWPVRIDPSQIDQILANLCVNARDAITGVGKVTIETDNASIDEDYCRNHAGFVTGDYAMLVVSDNGLGMDPETLANIFEPFYTTKQVGRGSGLGLATVYGIVKQNNGFINVYSEPEQGSTFKIYLPRYSAPVEDGAKPVEVKTQTGNETILIVEDEAAILALTASMLERLGYSVLAAARPEEAIKMSQSHDGDIHMLMTDVVMPDMSGKEVAEKIHRMRPGLKCLFMSGYTANVIAHHGVLDDNVNFIAKPFTKQALAAKVREVIDDEPIRS